MGRVILLTSRAFQICIPVSRIEGTNLNKNSKAKMPIDVTIITINNSCNLTIYLDCGTLTTVCYISQTKNQTWHFESFKFLMKVLYTINDHWSFCNCAILRLLIFVKDTRGHFYNSHFFNRQMTNEILLICSCLMSHIDPFTHLHTLGTCSLFETSIQEGQWVLSKRKSRKFCSKYCKNVLPNNDPWCL